MGQSHWDEKTCAIKLVSGAQATGAVIPSALDNGSRFGQTNHRMLGCGINAHLRRMLQAADSFPMNMGFTGKGNASLPQPFAILSRNPQALLQQGALTLQLAKLGYVV